MSIPLSTTTITVIQPDAAADPYETRIEVVAATGVRAHFSSPGGYDRILAGEQEVINMRLDCDPCPMVYSSIVVNEATQERWRVAWTRLRVGLGLDHMEAGLIHTQGASGS